MKDYESYNNKGNKDIPDNPRLKKLDVYPHYQDVNKLPDEYFDIRENALDCAIDDDDNYAYDPGEKGSMDTKDSLDNIQDLTNVVNTTQATAVVESAGAVVTGTATVVVGAAAAVVAFNATSKAQPTMKVNSLDSGSSFVHYNLEINNLDLDKDYDIIIRNDSHSFKFDCVNGINDKYVYNLKPGLEYSLTLVGYNELLGEIPYASKTFYTSKSEEILGYSNIEIIYNDDLTCGIKYDTTMVDDFNTQGDTFIQINGGVVNQSEPWDLFNSLYAEDFMREEPDKYTYEYAKKVHKGTISEVPPGLLTILLYKKGPEDDIENGELIASTSINVVYPIYEETGSNYVKFTGDYNLVKEVKKINVKKDNLVVKLTLYNDDNVETKFEQELDITNNKFSYRQLVKQDTTSYSYQIGYYKADGSFTVVKEKLKDEFYGGYYDASYNRVMALNEDLINVKWNYDDAGNETADITLLTDFNNFGNSDCFYRVELILLDQSGETQGADQYIVVDTFEGTGNAVFKNVKIGEYNFEYNYYDDINAYTFRYTSLMNYYSDSGKETVVYEVMEPTVDDDFLTLEPRVFMNNYDFELLSNGEYAIRLFMGESDHNDFEIKFDNSNLKLTLSFFKQYSTEITEVVEVKNLFVRSGDTTETASLVIAEELPTGMIGYYAEYDLPYYEMYGGNIRRLRSNGLVLMGDISPKATPTYIKQVCNYDGTCNLDMGFVTYMPSTYTLRAVGNNVTVYPITETDGVYRLNESGLGSDDEIIFYIYDDSGSELGRYEVFGFRTNAARENLSYYVQTNDFGIEPFGKDYIVYTYNNDGTININLLTGFTNLDPTVVDASISYDLKMLQDDSYTTICSVLDSTDKVVNFNSANSDEPLVEENNYEIEYTLKYKLNPIAYGSYTQEYEFAPFTCNEFAMQDYSVLTEDFVDMQRYGSDNYTCMTMIINTTVLTEDATITFSADGAQSMTFNMADCISYVHPSDGTAYYFSLSQELYEADILRYEVNGINYTITNEKLEALGNNYTGSIYNKYSYDIGV